MVVDQLADDRANRVFHALADTTRRDILAAGREIFSQHPYSEVSGLEICNHAGVTRGALQHHFGSKLGLFMAVFEGLQHGVSLQITQAIVQRQEPWDQVRAGIAKMNAIEPLWADLLHRLVATDPELFA